MYPRAGRTLCYGAMAREPDRKTSLNSTRLTPEEIEALREHFRKLHIAADEALEAEIKKKRAAERPKD